MTVVQGVRKEGAWCAGGEPTKSAGEVPLHQGRRSDGMLVITRREGEEVVIGNPASPIGIVRIASIKGDRVRIAFEFPREVAVHRKEVAEQILAGAVDPTKNVIGQIRPAEGGA
jgi:carbon storage regulator